MRNKPRTVLSKKHTLKTFLFGWTLICGVRIEAASGPPDSEVECGCTQKMTPLSECQLPRVWLGAGGCGGGAKTKNFSYGRGMEEEAGSLGVQAL